MLRNNASLLPGGTVYPVAGCTSGFLTILDIRIRIITIILDGVLIEEDGRIIFDMLIECYDEKRFQEDYVDDAEYAERFDDENRNRRVFAMMKKKK